jgi:iron complex transport system substrate-binding protein
MIASAEASSYTLGIFGNANMDEDIDEKDVAYVEGVIKGTNAATNLSDANYDGKIDSKDIDQIELIMQGKEKNLTVVSKSGWHEYAVVTVQKPIKSVITRFFDSAEMLRILDSTNKIVAVGGNEIRDASLFFPELSKLPPVAGKRTGDPDYEAILSIHPDIFLPWSNEQREKLPGINMVSSKLYGLNSTGDIKKLGYIFDKEKEAEEYIEWQENCLNKINEQVKKIPEEKRPRVLVGIFRPNGAFYAYHGPGGNTGMDELMTMIPMNSVGKELQKGSEMDMEWVIKQNPEIIILVESLGPTIGGGPTFAGYQVDDPSQIAAERENVLNRPELADVKAVKEGKVYMMDYKLFSYSQSMIVGAMYLAKWIYPDLDLNPEAIHQEYLNRFQHLDYDLNEHGVFAYPPIEIDGGLAGIPDKYKGKT